MSAKEIVKFLDMEAGNAETIGARPASPKQTWYLASLIAQRGDEWTYNTSAILTSKKASELISSYLK